MTTPDRETPNAMDRSADATLSDPVRGASNRPGPREDLPERIGPYLIVGKLGEGGMGVVFEAEQPSPRRRVALKVVRGGRFGDEVSLRLFQREAESLARLKHPNIAAIYESGRTDEGQHFFAMELVRGRTLDSYLRDHQKEAPTRAERNRRLELFRAVCGAVNYAHQRGVIHRDLKPSNIVVADPKEGESAGAPQIKILDFGLSRITDDPADATMSRSGTIRGTLQYMSPEQARGNPDAIDLRTDVYSLGIILYEMLCGALPYTVPSGDIVNAVRMICEESPRSLSEAGRSVDGELETIVFKALEKEPDRRYQSASALAEDIERYRTAQPILARPPSTIYQIRKLLVRNKLPFSLASLFLVSLIGFGIWMSVLYSRGETARQESDAVTAFLSDMLRAVDPDRQGAEVSVREVLDQAAINIDREFPEQPQIRARLMMTMGDVYRNLGYYEEARSLTEPALGIQEAAFGPDDPRVAAPLDDLASLARREGNFDEARRLAERALAVREKALGADHPDVALSLKVLANIALETKDNAAAESHLERALAIEETRLGRDDIRVTRTLRSLANVYRDTGRLEEAKPLLVQALEETERKLGPDHTEVGMCVRDLAGLYTDLGEHEAALPLHERALAVFEKAYGPDHPNVGGSLHNLALAHKEVGDLEGALPIYRRALAITEKSLGPDHPNVGRSLNNLANLLMDLGEYEASKPVIERAIAIAEKAFGPNHPIVSMNLCNYGNVFYETGDLRGSLPIYERALRISEESLGPDDAQTGNCCHFLGNVHRDMGNYRQAEHYYNRTQAIWETALGATHPHVALNLEEHAELRRKMGDESGAETLYARAKAIQDR